MGVSFLEGGGLSAQLAARPFIHSFPSFDAGARAVACANANPECCFSSSRLFLTFCAKQSWFGAVWDELSAKYARIGFLWSFLRIDNGFSDIDPHPIHESMLFLGHKRFQYLRELSFICFMNAGGDDRRTRIGNLKMSLLPQGLRKLQRLFIQ